MFRKIWRQDKVTAGTRFRPQLKDAEVWPRPYQQPIRVWHGSATSKESVDLAARYGDPLFSANVTNPIEPYAELIRYYRERWEHYGHDPADIAVGAGTAGLYAARTSQEALAAYRPVFEETWPSRRAWAWSRSSRRWRTSSSAARLSSAVPSRSSTRCTATTSGSDTRCCICTRTRAVSATPSTATPRALPVGGRSGTAPRDPRPAVRVGAGARDARGRGGAGVRAGA